MNQVLMKGNEAVGEGAVHGGCRYFFAYPITPQTEIAEYLARRLPEVGGTFLQAESEIASINMVYGAAGAGALPMTASSSPGLSLKQEGISYLAAAELPCVIVNVMRCGPGLAGVLGAQSDYFQATRGGGHGDYRVPVLGPWSVQECFDLTVAACDLALKYRTPAMVLMDGLLGQMMEPALIPREFLRSPPDPFRMPWATTGASGRPKRIVSTLILDPEALDRHNWKLQDKYRAISEAETRFEVWPDDAEGDLMVLVAYGSVARICKAVVARLRRKGIPAVLFRPISLWPFPKDALRSLAPRTKRFLVVEMSTGQMVEDVLLATENSKLVSFYGTAGGVVPDPLEIEARAAGLWRQEMSRLETGFSKASLA